MNKKYPIVYECECHSEGILLDVLFPEDPPKERDYCLSFYKVGQYGNKSSFLQRIRQCLNILKTGFPYTDQVILKRDKVVGLIETLKELIFEGIVCPNCKRKVPNPTLLSDKGCIWCDKRCQINKLKKSGEKS